MQRQNPSGGGLIGQLFSPAKGHACNFVKTVEPFSISLEITRESCVLPASSIKKRPSHRLLPWRHLDRQHQKRTASSCSPILYCPMKTIKLSCVPRKAGNFGAEHLRIKQTSRRYSPEPSEYMKSVYEGKKISPSWTSLPMNFKTK